MLSLALLVFFLASVIDGQEAEEKTPLPPDMKEVFMNFNRQYNTHLDWDVSLAEKALQESRDPQTFRVNVKLLATRDFWKTDKKPLDEKLKLTMQSRFDKRNKEVEELPHGSRYGCNGTSTTGEEYMTIKIACLFCAPGSTADACFNRRLEN